MTDYGCQLALEYGRYSGIFISGKSFKYVTDDTISDVASPMCYIKNAILLTLKYQMQHSMCFVFY